MKKFKGTVSVRASRVAKIKSSNRALCNSLSVGVQAQGFIIVSKRKNYSKCHHGLREAKGKYWLALMPNW